MQRSISGLRRQLLNYLAAIALMVVSLSIISAIIIAAHNKKNFVEPIKKVPEETMRFASGDMAVNKLGDFSGIEEIYNLARSIDKMEEDMVMYIENLTSVTAEKEKKRLL